MVINSFAFMAHAQIKRDSVSQNNLLTDVSAVSEFNTDSITEVPEKKSTRNKNIKGFIKKIFSNYEGFDLRYAWGTFSQKQY